ncbi:DNA repair helicase XPB [Spirochaeta isovalerica]|uniref:DNA 3'-5' helicase n=1 Tax=Spirochaeta isovalerica TaxID=150 RepID=A0A841RDY1_9SPIO|nr:DNA repair helicase XPB [Spirochaeta isovalerica]MBB6481591.1 DNA excision repair protein ERCC-3 [Spirochaeta isovalerica]
MVGNSMKPLIVQGDSSILLEVHNDSFEAARADINPFCELEKSPEHIHTYRISPLSLWNGASAGIRADEVLEILEKHSRYPIPENVSFRIRDLISRFGKLKLTETEDPAILQLHIDDKLIDAEIAANRKLARYLTRHGNSFLLQLYDRGTIKLELIKLGYPVEDLASLKKGDPLDFHLRDKRLDGSDFQVREYQREAAEAFVGNNRPGTGFGTIVLPCGSGKTIVGMTIMDLLKTNTLILTTNVAAVHQWIDELTDKSTLSREEIGEYTGDRKEIKGITIGTYQILVWRKDKESAYKHFQLFRERNWGLIIYDEVHLLPAPVFRVTAELQTVRRVGLTATLVREDGAEENVFSLVGPKRFEIPWKQLEAQGWIAEAICHEIRIDLPEDEKIHYATADQRRKFRIASENPIKMEITSELIANHREDSILVIGQYIDQLQKISKALKAPIITGKTPNQERERIFEDFRRKKIHVLVVSKVANFAINLPDASVAIQISGTFGSRQEEAQRLGRILRPKEKNSYFYSVVSRYTVEEEYAANRQQFLTEQGYKYHIEMWGRDEFIHD